MLINYFTGYPNTDETTPILDVLDGMKPSNTTRGGTSPLGELVGNFFQKEFCVENTLVTKTNILGIIYFWMLAFFRRKMSKIGQI